MKPVSRVIAHVATISVKVEAPWKSLKDFIEYAKKNPGMKYGTTGLGSSPHTMVVTIEKTEGVKFTHITFPGDSDVATAVLGGHILFGLPHYAAVKSQVEAGNVRVLAIYLEKKAELLPQVPTSWVTSCLIYPYNGLFAPKGTPETILNKLDKAIDKIKDDASFKEKVKDLGLSITYESTDSFRNSISQYRMNIESLFKELGYVKQ